ncbi:hypothetical protein L798_04071 [Zootermopsis nevadensis]|uniref:Uncharacterized protein n=1 Tax=Zootermopsis nevadensis TaxID=136037 RepID=A0A067RBP3_ZOONE|nr:hypothetical protein L798_04071 [Zootermopsis nevadensis]
MLQEQHPVAAALAGGVLPCPVVGPDLVGVDPLENAAVGDAEELELGAVDNGAAADEGNWNPIEQDQAAEEMNLERFFGLGVLLMTLFRAFSIQHWTFCCGEVQFERACCCISL